VPRSLSRAGLERLVDLLAAMRSVDRARLPGVSPSRSHQLLAGAIVAAEALEALELERVDVCPWALREGVILRRLDWLAGA
jgi:exopolyphosphatase/guanosine-5'-triphosphate,3'-diphosphate pyrophosphatase